ncbi:hypothetical protein KSD_08970 [Ktedonobacter sp. SOSP1-85]|nr:hypothetical protein KSD_08970 [Ktedonobacter sp. SOSP1-85]
MKKPKEPLRPRTNEKRSLVGWAMVPVQDEALVENALWSADVFIAIEDVETSQNI